MADVELINLPHIDILLISVREMDQYFIATDHFILFLVYLKFGLNVIISV